MRLFDTHCHLDDEQFDSNRDDIVQRAVQAGVGTILAVGTTADSSLASVGLAQQYETVLAAVGVQPNYCAEAAAGDWDKVVELANSPRVVALGETGLDRYWDHTPFDVQEDYFDRHIQLSQRRDLPFIVHLRDCEEDILRMLREARLRGALQGVMHSYTGSAAGAAACIELGLYVSFAGMVTYKKSDELREIAATIPDDRILLETDAPYLSPHPKRGQRPNEPALVVHTATCLAEARGTSLESFAELTTANANRLFKPSR
ncbi:MAG: TatD family hydrolase [Planctomycetes bacterium]|nr:TatD family hydrolase [Planctomycetota bacterium]